MSSIPTHRRIEYARGYLALGMAAEARCELDAIKQMDRGLPEVRHAWVDYYMETRSWAEVVATASALCKGGDGKESAWIAWAYALRELQQIKEAQDILHQAEPLFGTKCSVLHYNLACYACLLGDKKEARRRLARACKMNREWKESALGDSDLKSMWDEIEAL